MAEEDPQRFPSALEKQPHLPDHLTAVYEAFWALNHSRPLAIGMGGGLIRTIPVSEALAMAREIGWDGLEFLRVIRPADALYVDEVNRRNNGK